ncbi:MAG TPA: flagellar biosynthetic protein FliQ [Candidatus Binatus sp.]|nr:flagellar biosynthetic protein FliQ [Candidatus Binatus sp.]
MVRSSSHFAEMESTATHLLMRALQTIILIAIPCVAAVAVTGILTGAVQTIVQVQDQNVAFLPKLLVVALLIALAGLPALMLLVQLLHAVASALPTMLGS